MPFKQVTIIGTGLIGGSLGLALKKGQLAGRIIGCDRAPVLERAQGCGAIEAGSTSPADAVRGSDLVVLATPVISILDLIGRLGPASLAKTLVTDVGSTKAEIVKRAAKSFGRSAGQRFLPGIPWRARSTPAWSLPTPIFSKAPPGSSRHFPARTFTLDTAESLSAARKRWAPRLRSSIPPITIVSAPGSAICRR